MTEREKTTKETLQEMRRFHREIKGDEDAALTIAETLVYLEEYAKRREYDRTWEDR